VTASADREGVDVRRAPRNDLAAADVAGRRRAVDLAVHHPVEAYLEGLLQPFSPTKVTGAMQAWLSFTHAVRAADYLGEANAALQQAVVDLCLNARSALLGLVHVDRHQTRVNSDAVGLLLLLAAQCTACVAHCALPRRPGDLEHRVIVVAVVRRVDRDQADD